MTDRGSEPKGFALVLVLWVALLVSVVGTSLVRESRIVRQEAAIRIGLLRTRLANEAAINRVILSLVDPNDKLTWRIDGSAQELSVLGRQFMVGIESQAGCIDLNAAPASLLKAVFSAANLSPADSQTLAERIVEWRMTAAPGPVDLSAEIYRGAARKYGPRHNPFRSVDELRLVLGMTDDLQSAVAPALTVFSGSSTVDYGVANATVLKILRTSGDRFAAAQWSARLAGAAAGNDRRPEVGETPRISASVQSAPEDAPQAVYIRLTDNAKMPFDIVE